MQHRKTETGISILGGALLGAAAMYLLDPGDGANRRRYIRGKAGDVLSEGQRAFGRAWSHAHEVGSEWSSRAAGAASRVSSAASDSASSLTDRLSGLTDSVSDVVDQLGEQGSHAADSMHLHGLRDRLSSLAHELADRAGRVGRRVAGRALDRAGDACESAQEATHGLRHRLAKTLDPEHVRGPGHAVGYTAGIAGVAAGALAIGGASVYFFDPEKGSERRNACVHELQHLVSQAGALCRQSGEQVAVMLRRPARQMSRAASKHPRKVSGEKLVQQVRQLAARGLAQPAQVQFMADGDGVITLYGQVPSGELDALLASIRGLPGVTNVVNRLDKPGTPGPSSNGPKSASSPSAPSSQPAPQM